MYTECLTADTELTVNEDAMDTTIKADLITDIPVIEDWFATMPAIPAVSSQQKIDEASCKHEREMAAQFASV
ncbi:MAG: hypothetical protein E6I90_05470 [Chloroflexi bacterium]|nr:MAG: hypothetical protein E6I90_05470 [Chloroflexota bacterium]